MGDMDLQEDEVRKMRKEDIQNAITKKEAQTLQNLDLNSLRDLDEKTPPPAPEKMSDVDVLTLALAKSRSRAALAEAKTAVAQSEKSELDYRYTVLQLYRKYGLSDADAISEDGAIVRGGATQARSQ